MKRIDFNKNWTFAKSGNNDISIVDLPHDAMIHETRDPGSAGGSAHAFFPGGVYSYEKSFFVSDEWRNLTMIFEFEAVYRNSKVFLNGQPAGGRPYGYTHFWVKTDGLLKYGEENVIRVVADNSELPNSRWYSGSGIFRPVSLLQGGKAYIEPCGVRVSTVSTAPAKIRVETNTVGGDDVQVEILDGAEVIAAGHGAELELTLEKARLWTAETPNLYQCRITLLDKGQLADLETVGFGIRTITWSNQGLFINGEETLLRGGCVHHDNGILGACAFPEAEERRVRIMKEAGFNAIRSSHNPASRAMLAACDRYGVYMIDETWDMWYLHKSMHDYAGTFINEYEEDIRTLVWRDYNHPSVIMYSIGNEVSEPYQEKGIKLTRQMVSLFHELDSTRPVTAGINLMIINMASKGRGIYKEDGSGLGNQKKQQKTGSLLFNIIASMVGPRMNKSGNSDGVDKVTTPCLDALDIAGYNYGSGRYPLEKTKHPDRLIYGSETFPQTIAANWAMVKKYPYLIGDFMWTGWDYLGEVGAGGWSYRPEDTGFEKPYPWLIAGAGAIDILGRIDAEAHYAAAVWGLAHKPFIGVRPVNQPGKRVVKSVWRWTNARESWSWQGCDGNKAEVEVYADAASIELLLNGKSLGRKKINAFKTMFKTKYQPGVLKAIAYDAAGDKLSESELKTATGTIRAAIRPEKSSAITEELVFVNVDLVGDNGVTEVNADRRLTVSVDGGSLLAFGSANPCTEDRFDTGSCTSYFGRTLAVVRAVQPGQMVVRVSGEGFAEAAAVIEISQTR